MSNLITSDKSHTAKLAAARAALPDIRTTLRELNPDSHSKSLSDVLTELSDDIAARRRDGCSDALIARAIAPKLGYAVETVVGALRRQFGSNGRGRGRKKRTLSTVAK